MSDGRLTCGHGDARPQCRDQHRLYACGSLDAKSFVEAIT